LSGWDEEFGWSSRFRGGAIPATDKILKPPRGGGKTKEKSGFCSAERWCRSLLRQIPAGQMKFREEEMAFFGELNRLLA
jgi:hypothetical protein